MYANKILLGFIRVHILHHAHEKEGTYGSFMISELAQHGYDISPGTLYPILHEMRDNGLLVVSEDVVHGKVRKIYRTTEKGEAVLSQMKKAIDELSREVLD